MFLGPIHPTLPGLSTGHNPIKPIKVVSSTGRQTVLFDQDYSYAQQAAVLGMDVETVLYEASPAAAVARLTQIAELTRNSEWHRCGVFIQWREDGTNDPEDGWYNLKGADLSEEFLFSSYAEPVIQVEQRAIQRQSIGVFVDAKAVPNDANGAAVTLAAVPMGFANPYPVITWTLPGANGNITVVENAPSVLRAQLSNAITTMTQGRCRLSDQTSNRSTVTEVFWKDHRNINGNWEVSNDLLRYYFAEGAASPSIDIWDGNTSAWVTMGNYQLQVSNAGPVLPLQTVQFQTISPEEVIWVERRFDTAGTALVAVTNRVRRGSRIIESSIVAASGAGLTGSQSIGIVSAPNVAWTVAPSSDLQAVVFTDDFETPGTTATLWKSLGTDATGTLTYWTQVNGVWAIAANLVTSPAAVGNLMVGGHADWWDGTYNQRVKWVTANAFAAVLHCDGTDNNWIAARIDGANLHIDKKVGGVLTSDVIAATAAALTTGNFYWIQIVASGTTYTIKVFNDTGPGSIGTQVGSTMTTTISDASVQTGVIGMRNFAANAFTAGGAFTLVTAFSGPLPANGGVNWAVVVSAGEPAFCWSKAQHNTGSQSLSIFNAAAAGSGAWAFTSTLSSGTYMFTVALRGTGTPTTFQASAGALLDVATATSAWQSIANSALVGANPTIDALIAAGAGTYYADTLSLSAGGTGVAFTSSSKLLPGFCYLTQNPNAPTAPANTTLYSGATVPAGTITRIGILCGVQDAQYTALGATGALYAGRWANYGRQRIRQRILIGLTT